MERLPPECLLMILNYLPKPSLLNLCTTSKTLHDFGMPELYRHITIRYYSSEDLAFLERLQQSGKGALWVRSITIRSKYLYLSAQGPQRNHHSREEGNCKIFEPWLDSMAYRRLPRRDGIPGFVRSRRKGLSRCQKLSVRRSWDQDPLGKPEQIAFVLKLS